MDIFTKKISNKKSNVEKKFAHTQLNATNKFNFNKSKDKFLTKYKEKNKNLDYPPKSQKQSPKKISSVEKNNIKIKRNDESNDINLEKEENKSQMNINEEITTIKTEMNLIKRNERFKFTYNK